MYITEVYSWGSHSCGHEDRTIILSSFLVIGCLTFFSVEVRNKVGRAVIQAVNRWLPTAAVRVRDRAEHLGVCSGQSGTGADFLRVLLFPLPIIIPPVSPLS
jgi:hypothetical protein